jgi:small-conductance mechanosensitive channel
MTIWNTGFLGNSFADWLLALVIGLFLYGVLRFLFWVLHRRLVREREKSVSNTGTLIKGLLEHTSGLFIFWLAIFTAINYLTVSPIVRTIINTITMIVILVQAGMWLSAGLEFWLIHRHLEKAEEEQKKRPVGAIIILMKIVVWTVVAILILENIPGVHVTALLASLGIGGIAVGLALQKILGDLFASLTISIDQPFVEGDAITVGDLSGSVEHIGLKSTRVRSFSGEELIFSNSDLLDSRIHNYKRMDKRLVVFTLNVTYQTPYKKLQKIPKIIKDIIAAQPKVTFNRVNFKSLSDSALMYEIVYTVNTPDFNLYTDTQEKINLEIINQFQKHAIEFAYPTQTVLLQQ